VARPFDGLESREGWTERLNLFISLNGIEESVREGALIRAQLASTPPIRLLLSVSVFIDQPCHRPGSRRVGAESWDWILVEGSVGVGEGMMEFGSSAVAK